MNMIKAIFEKLEKTLWDFFILINLIGLFGGLVYRVYALNYLGSSVALILALISFIILKKSGLNNSKSKIENYSKKELIKPETKKYFKWQIATYLTLTLASFYLLFSSQTTDSIVSPWQKIPSLFFLFIFLSTVLLFFIYKKSKSSIFLIIHFFAFLSVALIIYKIGYGYDPFVHNATADLILQNGSVLPKTNYYLGLYGILIILKRFLFIPIYYSNLFLVPLLASIFIPLALSKTLKKIFENENLIPYSILTILLLPFSFFIFTTPQNFSYLLLLIIIILSFAKKTHHDFIILFIIALVALITQPIAGIPALLYVLILASLNYFKKNYAIFIVSALVIISAISLPLAFYFTSPKLVTNTGYQASTLSVIRTNFEQKLLLNSSENILLNLVDFINNYILVIFLLTTLIGSFLLSKHKKEVAKYTPTLLMFFSLTISGIITSKLNFDFLIDYEQTDFIYRIFTVSLFFLFPFFIMTLHWFFIRLFNKNKFFVYSFFIFFSLLITISLYNSYPRLDNYKNSKGYSTSQLDIDTVRWIDENTKEEYVVLANQQVSAGALKELGFSKYYKDNIYFYPVPTGGPLYQNYLDMVYEKPSYENAHKSMELTGVGVVYLVLNKYWWAFPKLYDEAKFEADEFKEFGQKEVVVFKYTKK